MPPDQSVLEKQTAQSSQGTPPVSTGQASAPSGQLQQGANNPASLAAGVSGSPDNVANPRHPEPAYAVASEHDSISIATENSLDLTGKSEGLLTDYAMQQLQLRSQPFVGASAEGELFTDETTFSQINEIRQAIINGETLILLMGELGAGKSTLLKQLTRTSGHRLQYFSVKGGERYTTHNLFNGILDAWKLSPPAEFENSVKEMLQGLQASHERNNIIVLLLDDVDQIPARELNLLLASVQYFNTQEVMLHVLMSAEPEFESKIPDLLHEGMQIPYSSLTVDPLLASRAQPYIQLRLNQAGHFDEFPLSEKQINTIANDASGLPGRINFLSAETLNAVYTPFADGPKKSGLLGGKGIGRYMWGLLALALIGVGLLWKSPGSGDGQTTISEKTPLQSAQDKSANNSAPAQSSNAANTTAVAGTAGSANTEAATTSGDSVENTVANAANKQSTAKVAGSSANTPEDSDAVSSNDSDSNNSNELQSATNEISQIVGDKASETSQASAAPSQAPSTESTTSSAQAPATTSTSQEASVSNSASTSQSNTPAEPDNNSTATTVAEAASAAAETSTTTDSDREVESSGAADDENSTAADTTAETSSTDDSDAELPAREESTAEPAPAPKAETASVENGDKVDGLESPNWVLLQNTDLFTIQMSASTDPQDVERFLSRAELKGPNSIYTFERSGTTWHALVHGLFESVPDARAAIEKMSPDAVRNQPWIRKVGSIQASLKSGGG